MARSCSSPERDSRRAARGACQCCRLWAGARKGATCAPHFVGLHALQVVPFVGWLASRRKRWPVARRVALVWTASGSYLGVMALLAWQALQGQPLLRPDAISAVAAGLIFRLSRPQTVDRARRYV